MGAQSGRPRKVDPKVKDLWQEIRHGDFEKVKSTIKEFGINVQDGDGRTALINSVCENQSEFVKWLLDNGADVNVQDRNGYSALHFVAQERLFAIGKLLLEKNADLELRDKYGNTPLWTAVMNSKQDLSIIKLFLDKGANLQNINNAGKTPMQMINAIYGDTFNDIIKDIVV
jgi:ankyrin repeat protein